MRARAASAIENVGMSLWLIVLMVVSSVLVDTL
jgi:hypothetical protein